MKRSSTSLRLLTPLASGFRTSSSSLLAPHLSRTSMAGLLVSSSVRSRLLATTVAAARKQPKMKKLSSEKKPTIPQNKIDDPELLHERLDAFAARIGFKWNNKKLLLQALTHPSFSHGKEPANERQEYFGDRTLNFLVCEHLANKYPNLPARALAHATQLMTNNSTLTSAGKRLGVQDFVRWTALEEEDRGQDIVIANTMEALVASLYEDQGLKTAREFVIKHILPQDENIDIIPFLRQRLPSNTLSDLLTRRGSGAPYYVVLQESARFSSKSTFVVGVYSDSKLLGQGSGQSIAKAQSAAAQDALNKVWGEKAYMQLPKDEY